MTLGYQVIRPGDVLTVSAEGAPTGLAGTIGVRIEDGDGNVVLARTTAGIVESEAGSGIYVKDDLVAPDAGDYLVLWDTGGATPAFSVEQLHVSASGTAAPTLDPGYPSLATLLAGSSSSALAALNPDEQEALRTAAILAVEAFAGQRFVAEGTDLDPVSKIVSGNGGQQLQLPARLAELIDLGISGSSLDASDVRISDDGSQLHVVPEAVPGNWYTRAIRGNHPPYFAHGLGTVTVTGVWGWTECPAEIVTAIRWDMEDAADAEANKLAGSLRSWERMGVSSISQGPLSVTTGRGQQMLSGRAASLIESAGLVWQPIGEVL
jgi:hypothetical protein